MFGFKGWRSRGSKNESASSIGGNTRGNGKGGNSPKDDTDKEIEAMMRGSQMPDLDVKADLHSMMQELGMTDTDMESDEARLLKELGIRASQDGDDLDKMLAKMIGGGVQSQSSMEMNAMDLNLGMINEKDIQLTDADLKDPSLLESLREIGYVASPKQSLSSGTSLSVSMSTYQHQALPETAESLKAKILQEKQKAVAFKRDGKIQDALQALRNSKELEAQLEIINVSMDTQHSPYREQLRPKPKQQVQTITMIDVRHTQPEIMVHATPGIMQDIETDEDVELTEEDMNDPELLQELRKVGWQEDADHREGLYKQGGPAAVRGYDVHSSERRPHEAVESVPKISLKTMIPAPAPGLSDGAVAAGGANFYSHGTGSPHIDNHQSHNHTAPASSPASPASRSRASSEELEDAFDSGHHEHLLIDTKDYAHPSPTTIGPSSTLVAEPEPSSSTSLHLPSVSPGLAEAQRLRQKAVELKRQGKLAEAIDCLKRSKILEKSPPLPEPSQSQRSYPSPSMESRGASVQAHNARQAQLDQIEENRLAGFRQVEELLVKFANDATAKAKEYAKIDRKIAHELVEQRKYYSSELQTLRAARHRLGQAAPSFSISTSKFPREVSLGHIPADALELSIIGIRKAAHLGQCSLAINFDLGFPSENRHVGRTDAIYGGPDFAFNFVRKFPIRRGNFFNRTAEIRKVNFEIYRSRMFSQDLVARSSLELKYLLSKCEVRVSLPLLDGKRAIGGELQVVLALQTPLRDKEIRTEEIQKLNIGAYEPPKAISQPPSPPVRSSLSESDVIRSETTSHQQLSSLASDASAVLERNRASSQPSPPSQKRPATAPPSPSPTASSSVPDDELRDPMNVDLIVSYEVMNAEIEDATGKLRTKPNDQDLILWKDQLESKKQMLEIDIGMGNLEQSVYVERLQSRMVADKRLCLALKKNGRVQEALRVHKRVKVMEKELAQADEAEE